jgi:hypothetical protein
VQQRASERMVSEIQHETKKTGMINIGETFLKAFPLRCRGLSDTIDHPGSENYRSSFNIIYS